MADNEDESAVVVNVPGSVKESDGNALTTEISNNKEGNRNGSVQSAGEDLEGSSEVIGQILGDEVVTSFIEAPEHSDCATVSGELLTALGPATTIIYVQPDGSFVESSGLSVEEQQQLLDQLSKQQLVQVTGNEPIRPMDPIQPLKPVQPPKPTAISNIDVQQVIDHVYKSQVRSQNTVPKNIQTTQQPAYITLETGHLTTTTLQSQPFTIVQNASQHLQSAAKQVALQQSQNSAQSLQQKVSTAGISYTPGC